MAKIHAAVGLCPTVGVASEIIKCQQRSGNSQNFHGIDPNGGVRGILFVACDEPQAELDDWHRDKDADKAGFVFSSGTHSGEAERDTG